MNISPGVKLLLVCFGGVPLGVLLAFILSPYGASSGFSLQPDPLFFVLFILLTPLLTYIILTALQKYYSPS